MRVTFASKIGVVLAAAGSAVGLGNIWRFPTEVGQNGGAAFIIVYVICVAFFGLPLMLSEFLIGRHTHANTADAFKILAPGTKWKRIGQAGILVAWVILSYYIVVAGWTLYYLMASVTNRLGVSSAMPPDYGVMFQDFVGNPWQPIVCMILFMLVTHLVVVRGVQGGIERSAKLMMPLLLGIILVLVVCSFSMPGTREAMYFLFHPDFDAIDGEVVLSALGQAFYSLSLAMGCLCTYASYFGHNVNLLKTAGSVCLIDTLVAITAGFIIFPAVFSVPGVEPDAGAGLVFVTLPYVFNIAFGSVPWLGYLFATMFYTLLLLSALTSAIGLLEVPTVFLHERYKLTRRAAARIVTVASIALGCVCSLSFGILKDFSVAGLFKGFTFFGLLGDTLLFDMLNNTTTFGQTIFDTFDAVPSMFIMPLVGMFTCIFTGWYLDKSLVQAELTNGGALRFPLFRLYIFLVRWVVPILIAAIFFHQLH